MLYRCSYLLHFYTQYDARNNVKHILQEFLFLQNALQLHENRAFFLKCRDRYDNIFIFSSYQITQQLVNGYKLWGIILKIFPHSFIIKHKKFRFVARQGDSLTAFDINYASWRRNIVDFMYRRYHGSWRWRWAQS